MVDVAGKGMNATEEHSFFEAYRDAGMAFYPATKNRGPVRLRAHQQSPAAAHDHDRE
jgi:hypothetical protein